MSTRKFVLSSDWRPLEALERDFSLARELVFGFASDAQRLAELLKEVVGGSCPETRASRIVIAGLINYANLLLIGALQP